MPEITMAVVQMHSQLGKIEDNLIAMGRFIDGEIDDAYAVATIDLDAVRRTREELQLLQCRVPQVCRSIVRKY